MRRMLRDDAAQAHLEDRGWSRLPPLDARAVTGLSALAREMTAMLMRHALSSDAGYEELWGNPSASERLAAQRRVEEIVGPFLERWVVDCRPVLSNICVKRARSPRSRIPFHRDFAVVDEREGECAMQIWIPLVAVGPENGALILVEGSHVDAPAIRPHDSPHSLKDHPVERLPPGAVQPALGAGEGVVFTNRTVHASTPNRTGEDRPAIGAILVPRDVPIVHWFERSPGSAELWAISDEDFRLQRPGQLPAGATLLDTVPK